MRYSFVLTVAEGKALIAEGLKHIPAVKKALEKGNIMLKGGTTVSAVSEALGGPPLSISGRVTPSGLRAAFRLTETSVPWLLLKQGEYKPLRGTDDVITAAKEMNPQDVVITGANLIDREGRAALMLGSPLGGGKCWVLNFLAAEGVPVFIAAGLEKMCSSVPEAVAAAGRMFTDASQGMAVGLLQLAGSVFTENDAIMAIAPVKPYVIGRGGITGAEGGTSILVEGEKEDLNKLMKIVESIKGAKTSGEEASLISCERGGGHCKDHIGCVRSAKRTEGTLWKLNG